MAINRIHTVTNRATREIKYFGSRPQAYRFLLEQKEKEPDPSGLNDCNVWELSEVLEYEYKYQLVVLLNDIFKSGYEGSMDFLSSGEMMGIINEGDRGDRSDSGGSEEALCSGNQDDRVYDDALRRVG